MVTENMLPAHIAIIPDGNRRWAKQLGKPAFFGHQEGAKAVETILQTALDLKIPCLTVWGCSVGNVTKRSALEVKFLFTLFEQYFKKMASAKVLFDNEVRVRVIGEWKTYFPPSCQKAIQTVIDKTASHQKFNLTLLLAYSGTAEMTAAIKHIAALPDAERAAITEQAIKQYLATRDLPPVDLVIRTGGEPHFSTGFMMWDVAEARLYFTETLWPDFSPAEFQKALDFYAASERREGK